MYFTRMRQLYCSLVLKMPKIMCPKLANLLNKHTIWEGQVRIHKYYQVQFLLQLHHALIGHLTTHGLDLPLSHSIIHQIFLASVGQLRQLLILGITISNFT